MQHFQTINWNAKSCKISSCLPTLCLEVPCHAFFINNKLFGLSSTSFCRSLLLMPTWRSHSLLSLLGFSNSVSAFDYFVCSDLYVWGVRDFDDEKKPSGELLEFLFVMHHTRYFVGHLVTPKSKDFFVNTLISYHQNPSNRSCTWTKALPSSW